jgi:hypothetical protein
MNANVRDKVVNEPSERYGQKVEPVTSDDEQIRDPSVAHRTLLVMCRILHVQPPNEDSQGGDDPQPEGEAPDGAKVVLAKSVQNGKRGSEQNKVPKWDCRRAHPKKN